MFRLIVMGPPPLDDGSKEKLENARINLEAETSRLTSEVRAFGDRVDPIGTIIRNIKRVQRG